jgi:curli production assembly/transport component CsgG/holdfast attachment protein HfaB
MTRARRLFLAPLALTLMGVALSGCVTPIADATTGRYAAPIGNAPVISNETPYSRSLFCIAGYNAGLPAPRIAVGQIADYTGKEEADGSGRKITQGAALMAISALSKAGVRLVERFDTSVAELELKYANNKLIGGEVADNAPYRKILAGSIPGSDYYLVGGITELNFNIRSEGGEADYSGLAADSIKANINARAYVMNVGLDLRLVDTKTLEVVDVISYQKQIIGREISAGVFDILGKHIINVGGGDSGLEPIQLAVRSVIERAVLEMVSRLYGAGPDVCSGGRPDPLGESRDTPPSIRKTPAAVTPPAAPAPLTAAKLLPAALPASPSPSSTSKEITHDETKNASYRWVSASNDDHGGLRGGLQ